MLSFRPRDQLDNIFQYFIILIKEQTMKICLWGGGDRALGCLAALLRNKLDVALVLTSPGATSLRQLAEQNQIKTTEVVDPNSPALLEQLRSISGDLFILAGYGKILSRDTLALPKLGTINLHAGKLPEYRGSSPLNWALINGEKRFGLSAILTDAGVDTGAVLVEQTFAIGPNDTIADLHKIANEQFPGMLIEAITLLARGAKPAAQSADRDAYYPLRFPEDGFVLFDQLTAAQVHNRVRALTLPYPCAFTLYKGRKVKIIASRLELKRRYGEPGRIYSIKSGALLVAALDHCLWLTDARFEDGSPLTLSAARYDLLATAREAAYAILSKGN